MTPKFPNIVYKCLFSSTLNPTTLLPEETDDCHKVLVEETGVHKDLMDIPLAGEALTWFTDGSSYLVKGLSLGYKTTVLAGDLLKPIIWTEPGSVIAQNMTVIIWCQGSRDAVEYFMYKEGSIDPWDKQFPLEHGEKAKFYIDEMSKDFAGIYKCYYKSLSGWSEHSDTLELVLTGAYEKPSLYVWPSLVVTSGECITMQCSSSLGFDRFILREEKHNLSWTMNSQQHTKASFQAHFVLGSVNTNHNGTFRCYGYFRNNTQVWSASSDALDVLVSESPSSQHKANTVENFIRMAMATLALVTLVILLLEAWHSKKVEKRVTRR